MGAALLEVSSAAPARRNEQGQPGFLLAFLILLSSLPPLGRACWADAAAHCMGGQRRVRERVWALPGPGDVH